MVCFPHCKINIGLHIHAKRIDGFHDIESVFYPLPLYDALEIVVADEMHFSQEGIAIPGATDQNIVLKAYQLLKNDYPNLPLIRIALLKNIPTGAGLGGGSADGAEMLTLLNRHFNLQLNISQLTAYAAQLGSDCPFFILNKPAYVTGRGENLEPISLDLSQYHFVIVKPPIHIATAWAFAQIKLNQREADLCDRIMAPIHTWHSYITNDFEIPIFNHYPEIMQIKKSLYQLGAVYSQMSGSGSAVYGIFETKPSIDLLKQTFKDAKVILCASK